MMFLISETDKYKVQGELAAGKFALHLRVYKWSPAVYKELLTVLVEILDDAKEVGYNAVYTGTFTKDTKARKCQEMFGFEYLGEYNGTTLMIQKL